MKIKKALTGLVIIIQVEKRMEVHSPDGAGKVFQQKVLRERSTPVYKKFILTSFCTSENKGCDHGYIDISKILKVVAHKNHFYVARGISFRRVKIYGLKNIRDQDFRIFNGFLAIGKFLQ
jgi:hypothetical protein